MEQWPYLVLWGRRPCTIHNWKWQYLRELVTSLSNALHTDFLSFSGEYFIGLNDKALEGEYRWVDSTVASYTYWMPGYPQDISAEQNKDCVVMRMNHGNSNNGKWETKECKNNLRFICECPGRCTRQWPVQWNGLRDLFHERDCLISSHVIGEPLFTNFALWVISDRPDVPNDQIVYRATRFW